jgi:hypothetical protein
MKTPSIFVVPSPADSDYASEMDRIWFEQHPGATERLRPPYPAELVMCGGACAHVRVRQVAPGVRMRMPVFANDGGVA